MRCPLMNLRQESLKLDKTIVEFRHENGLKYITVVTKSLHRVLLLCDELTLDDEWDGT